MARELPTGYATLTEQTVFYPALLAEIDWPGGMVRVWTGYGDLSWGGNTFSGVGDFGSVSQVTESSDLGANGITLSLKGIPSALVPEILANDAQGRSGKLYLAALDANGVLAADPYTLFDGLIDITPFEDGGETSTISVKLEKELIDRRAQTRRSTHEDQQIDYPGDGFFRYVAGISDKVFNWGGKSTAATSSDPGGGVSGGAFIPDLN